MRRPLLAWLLGVALAAVAVLPLCNLHFDCGCSWPGLGGWTHCDIHTAGPPDCPWCERPMLFVVSLLFSAAAGLAGAVWSAARLHFAWVVLVSLGLFWAGALLAGIVTSLLLGRPVLAGL